jgi:hypothetical protein
MLASKKGSQPKTAGVIRALAVAACLSSFPFKSFAGYELVCTGAQARSNQKVIYINCENRIEFITAIGTAWRDIRNNQIGGQIADVCRDAYMDAKELHPSISFRDISDAFTSRCNMGLAYIR